MNNSSNKQPINQSGGGGGGSVDFNQEIDTHKRGSIFSLYHVQTNSIMHQKTLTMYNTKTEYSQKSEVTLGADRRRKLFTQEDQDLKTLNKKKSFKSDGSNQIYESSTLRDQDNENDYDQEEQDRIIVEQNELDERRDTKSALNLDKNNNNMQRSQTSTHLIQLNEESMNQLNDHSQSETSMQGQRRSNNQLVSGMLLEKNIGFNRKAQSKSSVNQQNTSQSLTKNNSNMPSPLSKTIDYNCMESNPLFLQQQSLTALEKNAMHGSAGNNRDNKFHEDVDLEDINGELRKKITNKIFQAANSLVNQEGQQHTLQQKITQQKSEIHKSGGGIKSFQNFLFVNKVKKKLLSFLSLERYKNTNQFHLELINDVAALESSYHDTKISKEEMKLQRLSKEQFDEYKINQQVFQPDSILLILWNVFVMVILLFLIITTPIIRSFETGYEQTSGMEAMHRYISVIALITDILISFNKGYYDEGMIITNRKKIIKNYCKFKFFIDIFNVICCLLFEEIHILLVFLVTICRLAACSNIWAEIDEYLEISHKFSTLTQVLELMLLIFLIANLCACGFFYVSKSDHENGVKVTWITYQKVEDSQWHTQYIYSIYFEFITMTTIGYGDIFPCSNNERLYVIFMTLVSCAVFGYSLNAIGEIFREISQKLSSFKQAKYDISKYLKSRNITKRVQLKIFKYLEYLNRQEIEGHFFMKGEKILNRVSQNLREEVQREYYGKIISSIPFLTKNFSKNFLNELSLNMKELNLAPGDQLFKQGSQDSSLFFLSKGVVELYVPLQNTKNEKSNEKILHRYKGGDLIGHQEFLTDQERQFSVRSLSISHFIYVRKIDFLAILEKFPLDYEYFCTMRDDLAFKGQDRFAICESCKQTGHGILKCKLLFKNYNKLQIIKKLTSSEDNERIKGVVGVDSNPYQFKNILSSTQIKQAIDGTSQDFKRKKLKFRYNLTEVKENLKKYRKKFINDAIKIHKKYVNNSANNSGNQDQINEEQSSDDSIQHDNIDSSNQAVAFTQNNQVTGSFGMSIRQKTGSYAAADSMTFKSYQKTANNSEYSVYEDDRNFYKKYPKIQYEDGQYLILSSSQHSSSEVEEEGDEDEFEEAQLAGYGDYNDRFRTDDEQYLMPDVRKTITESQLRSQTIKRNTAIRPGTGVMANIPSPNNKIASITNMDTSIQIHNFSLENPNPTFLTNRIISTQPTSVNSSSMNSLPLSSLSAMQYQQQNSSNQQNSPVNGPMNSSSNLPPPPNTFPNQQQQQQLVNQIPPGSSINQLIINKNYFDSSDFLDEQQNYQMAENRKLTLILPTVEEASEMNELSSFDMTNSYSNQLSQSPLLRKGNRESSKRQQSRKLSQNTLPRQDSMQSINGGEYSLRRKSSRNDSANTKIMRDSINSKTRKVTYMDPQLRDQILSNFSSNLGSTLQNTLSKSHSRSSRHIPTNQFERSRSRQSQGTFLNNPHTSLYFYQFDVMKEYKFYYPHNNASSIIKSRIKNSKRRRINKGKKLNLSSSNLGFLKSGVINQHANQTKLGNLMFSSHPHPRPSIQQQPI